VIVTKKKLYEAKFTVTKIGRIRLTFSGYMKDNSSLYTIMQQRKNFGKLETAIRELHTISSANTPRVLKH
jgi:hypothetical protein